MSDNVGALIEHGVSDWQIFQQDSTGYALISLCGRWTFDAPGAPPSDVKGDVELRIVHQDTGVAVTRDLDWHFVDTRPDHTWSAALRVPAGGLYRLETRFRQQNNVTGEWSPRGDMRHFIGVGDLWVIAGQSNSAGYGRGPYADPSELGVHLFRNSEQWSLASHPLNESTDTKHACNREGGNPGHSPYIHFARLLKQRLNHPIGLVQTSLGGSPLCSWNPTEPGDPVLYRNMIHCVEVAGGKVKGVLWYQGESDTGSEEQAQSYAGRFVRAVEAWRTELKNPELAVVTVQLNRFYVPDEPANRRWSMLRESQRQVLRRLKNVTLVPTYDLPLSDGIHTSPAGNMLLAERMAVSALGAIYGQPVNYLAPDVASAKASDDGTKVELSFDNVTSRIECCVDPTSNTFVVEDESGRVPIERWNFMGKRIQLILGRALAGRGVVHGGYGANTTQVPVDVERFLPMLGFYGVAIEK